MNYQEYIKTELLTLVPVLYILGVGLKKSKLPDHKIPFVLGVIAILLSATWVIATSEISCIKEIVFAVFTALTQGILVAGAGVYANQLYIQSKKEK